MLFNFTDRRHEEKERADALPKPQIGAESKQLNKWVQRSDTSEEQSCSFAGVTVEETNGESKVQLVNE